MEAVKICNECGDEKNIEEFAIRNRKTGNRHKRCKKCTNVYAKNYREENKDLIKEKQQKWYNTKGKAWKKQYEAENRDRINERDRKRYHEDANFRMRKILRSRFKKTMLGKKKYNSVLSYLGIPLDLFIQWIEYQFDEFMTWENQGIYWDIDHVRPCSAFDLTKETEVQRCFYWANLRPLEQEENNSKSDTVDEDLIIEHRYIGINFLKSLSYKQNRM